MTEELYQEEYIAKPEYANGAEGFILFCEDNLYIELTPFDSLSKIWVPMSDIPKDIHPETGKSYWNMWEEQKEILREALRMENNKFVYRLVAFCWPRGEGKCQEKGSKILMFDGSVKKVEDVIVGDILMGDDNTPRKVLSLANGKEDMYEVVPMRGEPMVVTAEHILTLKRRRSRHNKRGKPFEDSDAGKIIDISLNDYQKQNKWFKDLHLLYHVPIEWPEQDVTIDPYFLGLWLGDGSSSWPHITTMDKEVIEYLYDLADRNSLYVTINQKKDNKAATYQLASRNFVGCNKSNVLLNRLRGYNLIKNKHIPQIYKTNSREVRLKVLAGLVDSDGYVNRNSIQITLKVKQLADDIVFLARSLGFHVEIKQCKKGIKSTGFSGEYYRVGISGDCSIIPTLIKRKRCSTRSQWKDVLVTGIKEIKAVGKREYYGFMLDGNGRYVTADFTVTHNSLMACLIKTWKFCVWPRQKFLLGANSKDQVDFVHFDIIKGIIQHSPKIRQLIGMRNIKQKEVCLTDDDGIVQSQIMPISSFTGLLSNINGYTFSDLFKMKDSKFFTELDGSIRNIPNAMGCIDSTVSPRTHILYHLYDAWKNGEDPTLYFSYRCSQTGDVADYWNPEMTERQLNSYRVKFPFGDFEKFFLNRWDAGAEKLFTPEQIEATRYFGIDRHINKQHSLIEFLKKRNSYLEQRDHLANDKNILDADETAPYIEYDEKRLWHVESVLPLRDASNKPIIPEVSSIDALSDIYDTNWALLGGLDRAEPDKTRTGARTILSYILKGLPGSRTKPAMLSNDAEYIYVLIGLSHIQDSRLESIKESLQVFHDLYDGLDILGGEKWGAWDLDVWCDERNVKFDIWIGSHDKQKAMFAEFYNAVRFGRFKVPPLAVPGSKGDDIFEEEAGVFTHESPNLTPGKKSVGWFGSPEKFEKNGVQDDAIYSIAGGIFAGKALTSLEFRERKGKINFGAFYKDPNLLGSYR